MSDERKQSLFIVAYQGRDTADAVHAKLRELQKAKEIDIKTAAVVYRKDNGKLKLVHKRRLTVWKGAFGGAAIGLLLAGTGVGALAAAGAGALIGSSRSGGRRDAKEFLEDKLGPDDSAVVVLVSDADWAAVQSELEPYGGEDLKVELTAEAEEQIAALAAKDDVAEAVEEEVEIEEEDVAE
jgi:uncharacterized membrane protein